MSSTIFAKFTELPRTSERVTVKSCFTTRHTNAHILLDIRHRLSYPSAMDKPDSKTKLTAIRIDRVDLDALGPIANDSGRSVASCIREAIKEWIKARARKAARQTKPPINDAGPLQF